MIAIDLVTRHCTSSRSPTFHGDVWVTAEVDVRGSDSIRHIIGGHVLLEYAGPRLDETDPDAARLLLQSDAALRHGYIALQAESHPLEFRNIEVFVVRYKPNVCGGGATLDADAGPALHWPPCSVSLAP